MENDNVDNFSETSRQNGILSKLFHRKYRIVIVIFLLITIASIWLPVTNSRKNNAEQSLTGLVHYWPMDEGNAKIINDIISGKNGDIYGAAWTDGISGSALSFNGISDYVALPANNPKWLPRRNFTVSVWVYFERDPYYPTNEMILDLNYSNSDYSEKEIGYNIIFHALSIPRKLTFQMHTISATDEDLPSDLSIVPEKWYYVTIVRDETIQSIYINGKLIAWKYCSPYPVKFYDAQNGYDDDKLNVGRFTTTLGSPRYYFKGKIDEISLFDSALSAGSIKKIYDNYLSKSHNPLMIDPNKSDIKRGNE
jgi:hypothetical protein